MELLLIVIAGYAFYQYTEFQKFQKSFALKISKIGFDLDRSLKDSFRNLFVNVTITVNNPTELSQSLKSVNIAASYQGKVVGTLNLATTLTLKSGSNVYVLPIALNTLNVFASVHDAYKAVTAKTGISLQLTGNVKVADYDLPINETLKVA